MRMPLQCPATSIMAGVASQPEQTQQYRPLCAEQYKSSVDTQRCRSGGTPVAVAQACYILRMLPRASCERLAGRTVGKST